MTDNTVTIAGNVDCTTGRVPAYGHCRSSLDRPGMPLRVTCPLAEGRGSSAKEGPAALRGRVSR